MPITITRIRSGGQSGVDRAALDFARKHNMEICGWCPKGGWAEDYPEAPGILVVYPELQETPKSEPWQRSLAADGVAGSASANGIELCIGGPRASECPEGYRVTMEILEKVLEEME